MQIISFVINRFNFFLFQVSNDLTLLLYTAIIWEASKY